MRPLITAVSLFGNLPWSEPQRSSIAMEFCALGMAFLNDRVTKVDVASTRALIDFDVIIVDPAGIRESHHHQHYDRRRTEFKELLALGGSIIWFVRPLAIHYVLPIDDAIEGHAYSGTKTTFVGLEAFRDFWKSIESVVEYEAYLDGAYGEPFVKVRNSDKTVASWIRHGPGRIILVPCLKYFPTPQEHRQAEQTFLNATEALLQQFGRQKSEAKLPPWSLQYTWKSEAQTRRKLAELETLAEQTARGIATTSEELQIEQKLKLLFTAKGDELVEVAIDAFQELGANVTRGDPGRDDIILGFEGKFAVVEVKGKKGSAAERDAAQLEKWVAGFKETRDTEAKGVLLVNAFCETPLAERTEAAFPNQMLKYSEQREHCLLTSTQLLGMVLMSRGKENQGAQFLNKILSTTGRFNELDDYNMFLEQTVAQTS